jgi:hypothetical protein
MRREKHIIQWPCERAKQFPIVLEYDETKSDGPKTQELECPFCQTMLSIKLPGTVQPNELILRGTKKAD